MQRAVWMTARRSSPSAVDERFRSADESAKLLVSPRPVVEDDGVRALLVTASNPEVEKPCACTATALLRSRSSFGQALLSRTRSNSFRARPDGSAKMALSIASLDAQIAAGRAGHLRLLRPLIFVLVKVCAGVKPCTSLHEARRWKHATNPPDRPLD